MPLPDPTALMLARIQFALNISFHILFPTLTIGMSWLLLYDRLTLPPKDKEAEQHFFFWAKIFGLSFALGAVSGTTMSFQFATNWPGFMNTVGAVAGPLLASEVLSAFFLEASFLGIMLFGYRHVPQWLHKLACALVACGTTLSAFWIIALNSWMHTPSGFHMAEGVAVADDWFKIIFNPSMPYRFLHTCVGSLLASTFFMGGISAIVLLKHPKHPKHQATLKRMMSCSLIFILLQFVLGDLHGLNTHKHNPALIAAIEGLWESRHAAPMILFALIDTKAQCHRYTLELPYLSSLYLTHDPHGWIEGITSFTEHPPVLPVFWAFRIMVGTGLLMLIVSAWGRYHLSQHSRISRFFLYICSFMSVSGWVASLAGWYVTEIGRQPYLVYGILKTQAAVSETLNSEALARSLALYACMYAFLLSAYLITLYTMARNHHDPHPQ